MYKWRKATFPHSRQRTITDIRCAAIHEGLIAFYFTVR
jgi:hypothetical protein